MDNKIFVMYEEDTNWKKLNANPVDSKIAIRILYAIAPFKRAKVYIGWVPPTYYTYENSRVKRIDVYRRMEGGSNNINEIH